MKTLQDLVSLFDVRIPKLTNHAYERIQKTHSHSWMGLLPSVSRLRCHPSIDALLQDVAANKGQRPVRNGSVPTHYANESCRPCRRLGRAASRIKRATGHRTHRIIHLAACSQRAGLRQFSVRISFVETSMFISQRPT
jgi:hypothetical protein